MKIVLFASGDFAIPTLRSLTDPTKPGHELLAVVTQPNRESGRGRQPKPTPVRTMAESLELPVLAFPNINAPEALAELRKYPADIGVVIAFGQKIGADVRGLFHHECVNLHASILPAYRGAAPFQWTILNGDEKAGVTVFRLVDRMDAGPVFVTRWTQVKEDERASELHDRLAMVGVDAVRATLDTLTANPTFEPAPQDDSAATRAPKLSKQDSMIRFDAPAREIANRINGLWSWPGAKCRFVKAVNDDSAKDRSETVTFALARVADTTPPKESPGTLDYRRYIATSDGYLEVLEIKPDGARLMAFPEFVNGRHLAAGDRFEAIEST